MGGRTGGTAGGGFGIEGSSRRGVVCMVIRLQNGVLVAVAMWSLDELSQSRRDIMRIGVTSTRANPSSSSVHSWGSSSVRTSDSTFESGYLLLCLATYTPRQSSGCGVLLL